MAKQKNKLVNDPGEKFEFTEEMINELYKSKKDVLYFANNYCFIVHPTEGRQKLKLRDYQEEFIKNISLHRSLISLQPRQVGKCCDYCSNVVVKMKNNENKEVIEIGKFFDNL